MCRLGALALGALVVSAAHPHDAIGQQTTPTPTAGQVEAPARPAMAGPAQAADGLESPEALRARIDSLRPLLEQARIDLEARNDRTDEARRVAAAAQTRVDTLRVGPLTVLTPSDQAELAGEIFQRVWQESHAHLGRSPALAASTVVFQWSDDRVPIHVEGDAHRVELDGWTRRSRVERAVSETFAAAMARDLRADRRRVGLWVQGNPLAAQPMERVYRMVATAHSRAARACLAGDARACASAMGLADPRDLTERQAIAARQSIAARQDIVRLREIARRQAVAQLQEWYTPEERRSLVATAVSPDNRGALASAWRRCVVESDIAACDRVLTEYIHRDWTPLDAAVRETLLAYAIERGGPDAWERLIEDPEMTAIEAMEHASGESMSELLSGWRARLVASRPDVYEPLIPRSGMTLVWTLIFAALAMRSTRWRLG